MESVKLNIKKRLVLLVFVLFLPCVNAATKLNVGDIPPNYIGKDVDGEKVNLEDNKGKVVIVSFWASWCAPCLKELPLLDNIQSKLGKDKVKVIAVNFKENNKQYRNIKKKLSYLQLTLTHDKRGSIGKKFGVEGIPHLFIIGKDGKLVYQSIGYGDGTLDKIVDALNEEFAS